MAEYIEREAAIKRFNFAVLDCLGMEPTIRAGDIIKALESIPAADVRPVVLCRDCKYAPSGTDDRADRGFGLEWPHDEWPEDNPCPCKCADGWYSHKPAPDFFCAVGEKMEETNA